MRISDWSSDVCSSDLRLPRGAENFRAPALTLSRNPPICPLVSTRVLRVLSDIHCTFGGISMQFRPLHDRVLVRRIEAEEKTDGGIRSEERSVGKECVSMCRSW